jgi:protein TonB
MTAAMDPQGPAFGRSLLLHVAIVGGLVGWQLWQNRARERWGDPNAISGGSVTITPVARIPIPTRAGIVNPVANDTPSELPTPPKEQPKPQEKPKEDPDAVALNLQRQRRTQAEVAARNQRYRPQEAARENQVTSTTGQRAVSPMFGVQGSGGVGTGTGSVLGTRFGWYEALLRQRVAEKWRTTEVDARIRQLPVAIVTFTIRRDGSVSGVRVAQSSGNYTLDTSAQRAVFDAAPFPPLPPQFDRDSAVIEFWFELKR